jgi:hypothetical protein
MKKFTRNFLLGEHSIARFLRKIGLSLVVLLWTFTAFAQEAQSTYEVWAKDATYCYQEDNTYEVDITMKDFIAIYEFGLKLNFSSTQFTFDGVDWKHAQLTTMTAVATGGVIDIKWTTSGDPVTIAASDNAAGGIKVATLKFKMNNTPYFYSANSVYSFTNTLTWGDSYFKNTAAQAPILTFAKTGGALKVNQQWTSVTVDIDAADCFGTNAIATVTVPAQATGMQYAWNNMVTFTTNPSTNIISPAVNQTVVVKSNGCISYVKTFDVEGPAAVTFTTEPEVSVNCPGGFGDIEIFAQGGTKPYTYYVVPDAMWSQFINELWFNNNQNLVNSFKSTVNVFQKPVGTYHVAVQDANGCVNLVPWWSEDYYTYWKTVTVYDNLTPFTPTVSSTHPTCNYNDGTLSISMTGGTPFSNGYNIYVNNVYVTRAASRNWTNLAAGTYNIMFQDANGCTWSNSYTLVNPAPIEFDIVWTDTGCQQAQGTLKLVEASIKGGTGAWNLWKWEYTTDPSWSDPSKIVTVNGALTEATGIKAGIYYVRVFDATGCASYWENAEGDDAVKILDTKFNIAVNPVLCYGGTTTATLSVVSGSGNHTFEYSMDGGTNWVKPATGSTSVTFNIASFVAPDTTIHFMARDITVGCDYPLSTKITQPSALSAYIIPYLTLPPSCPEGTDGNLAIQVSGGTPWVNGGVEQYQFKIDEGNWVTRNALFTYLMDNQMHKIYIRDKNGCETQMWFDFPDFQNKISFKDTIWTQCPMDKINLFNGYPEECEDSAFGFCLDGIDMDLAYFNVWESQWHGIPLEHFLGAANKSMYLPLVKAWLTSLGFTEFDVDALIEEVMTWGDDLSKLPELLEGIDFEVYGLGDLSTASVEQMIEWMSSMNFLYRYWTSDEGWKTAVTQGLQPLRNPMLYISAEYTTPEEIYQNGELISHTSAFGAGTYYIVARDEFGCYSNVEKIVIIEPRKLEVTLTEEAAGCFGATDGGIIITAQYGSNKPIPGTPFGNPVLQYAVVNNPAIFNVPNWHSGQVTWLPLDSNPKTLTVQAGTYYVAVRDYCAINHPELIVINSIVIDGAEELKLNKSLVEVKNVTCNVYGATSPSNDGHILIPQAAVTGGFGGYEFELVKGSWKKTNTTGIFTNLEAGVYTLTIEDSEGCYTIETFTITQTAPFRLETAKAYPSCFDQHDGFIRYHIYGGTAPFFETTNNVGQFETVSQIPDNRWVKIETTGAGANAEKIGDYWAFDRRVRNGHYEIYVKDSKGCIFGPVKVMVYQPAQLGLLSYSTVAASCAQQNGLVTGSTAGGSVTVTPKGGWNVAEDGYYYTIQVWQGATLKGSTTTMDVAAPFTVSNLGAGTYTVKVWESNSSLAWQKPIITDPLYFSKFSEYAGQLPWQNPDVTTCFYQQNIVVAGPEQIDYSVAFNRVVCNNTATGSIVISNVTGGTGNYQFAISGPAGSGYEANPLTTPSAWKTPTPTNAKGYTFTGLIHGHYNIYLRDANGCTIFRESGEVNNVPLLTVNMLLHNNAVCFQGLGKFEVIASGGVPAYKYAVTDNTYNFNTLGESGLTWVDSPVFEKPAGVWVGYVKDANGCIQGGPTTSTGVVIQQHRVTILQPTKVTANTPTSTAALCYDAANGKINVTGLAGGNGGKYSALVTGMNYKGEAVEKAYVATLVTSTTMTLDGLKASTNKPSTAVLTNADKYKVVFYDSEMCESDPVYIAVHQPEEFEIVIKAKQDAFICNQDKAGLFDIIVAKGGTPFAYDTNNKGIFEFQWEARTSAGVKVDSLTGTWGFTSTFLGYADLHYYVTARDKNGCLAYADTFVVAPAPVVIAEIKDITCYGATMASARITVSGEAGRTFKVRTLRFAGNTDYLPWSAWSAEFTESIEINTFSYGDESEKDGHYKFQVMDNKGCLSEIETMTFVPVQHPLALIYSLTAGECTAEGNATITGGISPYQIYVDDVLVTGSGAINTPISFNVHAGTRTIKIVDAHECVLIETITVQANPVMDTDAVVTFVGEDVQYVNAEYGVDEMLNKAGSPYTFTYETEEGCVRTLTVTVTEVVRQVTIAEVQGTSWESPVKGMTRGVTGTVTGVVPGAGYFIQDAVAPWSGIWIADPVTVVLEGNGVHVEGVVTEVNGITTIVGKGSVVNPPLTITPIVLDSPELAKDEKYESVLVQVKGVRALAAKPDATWDVFTTEEKKLTIGKWMYTSVPDAGDFYNITGIVNGANDLFRLEPRKAADVVNITKTTDVVVIETIDFKVYPNPFNNELNIDNHDKLTRVTVTNIAGQRVMDVQYPERVIRTANLVSGVYVVTLFTEDGIAKSERIVKR